MKKIMVTVLALCLTLALVLSGCGTPAPTPSASSEAPAASSEAPAASSSEAPAASSEAPAASGEEGVLKVGMECGYVPYNWSQPDDSNGAVAIEGTSEFAGGYDVEIGKIIAKALNKKLVVVKTDWNGLVPAVQSGVIDAIIAGMSPIPERREQIDFSNSYYRTDIVLGIVVKKDSKYASAKSLSDFAGAKITGQLGTFHYDVIDQIKDVQKQEAMKDFPAMRVAVESNIIDGYVSEKPDGDSAVQANPNFAFVEFTQGQGFNISEDFSTISIGIKKGQEQLLKDINAALAGVTEEQRKQIMETATKNQPAGN